MSLVYKKRYATCNDPEPLQTLQTIFRSNVGREKQQKSGMNPDIDAVIQSFCGFLQLSSPSHVLALYRGARQFSREFPCSNSIGDDYGFYFVFQFVRRELQNHRAPGRDAFNFEQPSRSRCRVASSADVSQGLGRGGHWGHSLPLGLSQTVRAPQGLGNGCPVGYYESGEHGGVPGLTASGIISGAASVFYIHRIEELTEGRHETHVQNQSSPDVASCRRGDACSTQATTISLSARKCRLSSQIGQSSVLLASGATGWQTCPSEQDPACRDGSRTRD